VKEAITALQHENYFALNFAKGIYQGLDNVNLEFANVRITLAYVF
jgi:hypothetical protein